MQLGHKWPHWRGKPQPQPIHYQMTLTPNPVSAASFVTIGTSSINACAASIRSNGSL